ncbi:unnamed protein product [Rhodiola kirilowii]
MYAQTRTRRKSASSELGSSRSNCKRTISSPLRSVAFFWVEVFFF